MACAGHRLRQAGPGHRADKSRFGLPDPPPVTSPASPTLPSPCALKAVPLALLPSNNSPSYGIKSSRQSSHVAMGTQCTAMLPHPPPPPASWRVTAHPSTCCPLWGCASSEQASRLFFLLSSPTALQALSARTGAVAEPCHPPQPPAGLGLRQALGKCP